MTRIFRGLTLLCACSSLAAAQQVPDNQFAPHVSPPAYASGSGPRVVIDGAHHNFHTVDGRYSPFANLARRDGYRVAGNASALTDRTLADIDILVLANSLNVRNINNNWNLPTPSAFTPDEVAAVKRFVERGGALLMIADHMPFGGAIQETAIAFGIEWVNGFAYDENQNSIFRFNRTNGLVSHPIFNGRNAAERIDSIVAFTGSAFTIPAGGAPLFNIPAHSRVLMPDTAWQFSPATKSISGDGLFQGATLVVGKGRIVAAGEAAMFSAQRSGPQGQGRMGFNEPSAPQNAQFALNVLHWLSGLLPAQ